MFAGDRKAHCTALFVVSETRLEQTSRVLLYFVLRFSAAFRALVFVPFFSAPRGTWSWRRPDETAAFPRVVRPSRKHALQNS